MALARGGEAGVRTASESLKCQGPLRTREQMCPSKASWRGRMPSCHLCQRACHQEASPAPGYYLTLRIWAGGPWKGHPRDLPTYPKRFTPHVVQGAKERERTKDPGFQSLV